jgi:uncharacterized RDD family membrane protein YckC
MMMSYPPTPSGGYLPPPGGDVPLPQEGGGFHQAPASAYTPWGSRALAFLIDVAPVAILYGIGSIFLVTMQKVETVCVTDGSQYQLGDFCATGNNGPSGLAWALFAVCDLIGLAYMIWNIGFKQGTTGSSIGKGIMRFKVVSEQTGQPIGFGMSIVRQIAHVVDSAICYIGWLFPLWDAKRQTIADKLVKTVCLPL